MFNSAAAGHRLARELVLRQLGVTVVTAALALPFGMDAAAGVASSGAAVALGTLVMAWRTFSGVAPAPGLALLRLIVGMVLKWGVIVAALYGALAIARLPALAVLIGLVATLFCVLWPWRTATWR